jgi:hypothetical protein
MFHGSKIKAHIFLDITCFFGILTLRIKIIINNKIIEQVSSFTYLGSKISDEINADLETRLCKYNNLNGVIKRHFRNKMKTFYLDYITLYLNRHYTLAVKRGS